MRRASAIAFVAVVVGAGALVYWLLDDDLPERPDWAGPLTIYDDHGVRGGHDAALVGVLQREGDCLYVQRPPVDDGGPRRLLPAFPSSLASWDEARQVLRVGSEEARVGDRVILGGGELAGGLRSLDWVAPPADECDTKVVWIASDDFWACGDPATTPQPNTACAGNF